jgi:hypothetical protein
MSELPENMVPRILQDIRRGLADQRTLLLLLVEQGQRHDRSIQEVRRDMREIKRDIHEVKEDLVLMLKAELMGRMGNFESRFEARLEALESQAGEAP